MARPVGRVIAICAAGLLAVSGCTSTGEQSVEMSAAPTTDAESAPDPPPARRCTASAVASEDVPAVVRVWSGMRGRPGEAVQAIVDDFNARSSSVQIELRLFDNTGGVAEALLATDPSARPALALMDSVVLGAVASAGIGTPVQACLDEAPAGADDPTAGMVDLARATYEWRGQQYALPFGASTPVLFYDRQRFRDAGLDPDDPPQTLDELREAAETLISSGAASGGLVVDDTIVGNWMIRQLAAQTGTELLSPDNGVDAAATTARIDTPAVREWMDWLQAMIRDGLATDIGPNPSGADGLLAALDPQTPAAMTVTTSAAIGEVIRFGESGAYDLERLGVGPLPGPGEGAMVGGSGVWITTQDPDTAAAAWEVVQALVGPVAQAQLAAATGYLPVTDSALDEAALVDAWAAHPQLRVGYDQVIGTPVSAATIGMISPIERELVAVIDGVAIRVVDGADVAESLATGQALAQGLLDAAVAVVSGQSGP